MLSFLRRWRDKKKAAAPAPASALNAAKTYKSSDAAKPANPSKYKSHTPSAVKASPAPPASTRRRDDDSDYMTPIIAAAAYDSYRSDPTPSYDPSPSYSGGGGDFGGGGSSGSWDSGSSSCSVD